MVLPAPALASGESTLCIGARKYPASAAQLHLLLPAFLHLALTDRPVNEPAEMPCLKFPCRAILPDLLRTSLYDPTGSGHFFLRILEGHEEKQLAFDMHRDAPPSLLEALYGFGRSAQELGHLLLRLA